MTNKPISSSQAECWRCSAIFMLLTTFSLAIALAIVSVMLHESLSMKEDITGNGKQAARTCALGDDTINPSEQDEPSVFADLTQKELSAITDYLHQQPDLGVVNISQASVNSTYIYLVELMLPDKSAVLNNLDSNGSRPERWAKVTLFRGDLPEPAVQEYRVGPLPSPTSHELINYSQRRKNPVPFEYRPPSPPETLEITKYIISAVSPKLGSIIYESFGVILPECGSKCLTFTSSYVSSSNFGNITRRLWIGFNYELEFYTLHPLDLQLLIIVDDVDPRNYRVSTVWYNQQQFDSLDEFLEKYSNNSISKIRITFPANDVNLFSTLHPRGDVLERENLRPPRQVEPDGKRYEVQGQHVKYLGWSFDYRMSTTSGPMIFDLRFRNDRIAYEISLQEVAVFYSANNPLRRFSNFVDSFNLLGYSAKTLIPGGDCPTHATFLSSRHITAVQDVPIVFENSLCLFEQSTGMPLRRHHSYTKRDGSFYSGMMDDVLTLRTILTIGNYDYIIDFVFHQNGAVEVKAASTGYIVSSVYSSTEDKYGFRLHEGILGNVHHHMFNFKVDIDIGGTSNRFETLNIGLEDIPNSDLSTSPDAATMAQIKIERQLRSTEIEAAYKYNFENPKYLLFHNNNSMNGYGHPRAYRLAITGMSKQTLPEGRGHEPAISWARYEMAVTKFNQNEQTSSSVYAQVDASDPVVNFQKFLDDNETIIDEDLVAWVTLGVHHIPHTEDLPVTTTVGGQLQFFLLPFNYFPEDPSMASKQAIRIDRNETSESKVNIERYGIPHDLTCVPPPSDFDYKILNDSSILFPKD